MNNSDELDYLDIKKKTFLGAFWSIARIAFTTLSTLVVFIFLARILGPADFGLFALASLFIEVGRIFTNAGINDAVIRQPVLEEEMADTAFWANFGFALLVATVIILFAPIYAGAVKNPQVTTLLQSLALTLPVASLSTIHGARLYRDYKHKIFAVQAAIASVISGAAGVGAALYGFGVWSLVIQAWVSVVLSLGMMWFALPWVPKLRFSRKAFYSIAGFSFSTTSNQLVWLLMARAGDILISRGLGVAELGRYRIAWRMYELIGQLSLAPIGGVSMLTFAKLQHDLPRLRSAYARLVGMAAVLAFPLLLGYAALANEIIEVLFSHQWAGTGRISQILALMLVPFVFNYISPAVLAAINRPSAVTRVAVIQLVFAVAATWISLPWGLTAVAIAYVAKSYLIFPYLQYQLKTHADIPMSEGVRAVLSPLLVAVAMALIVWLLRPLLHAWIGDTMGVIAAGVAIGGLVYGAGIMMFARRQIEPALVQATNIASGFLRRFR